MSGDRAWEIINGLVEAQDVLHQNEDIFRRFSVALKRTVAKVLPGGFLKDDGRLPLDVDFRESDDAGMIAMVVDKAREAILRDKKAEGLDEEGFQQFEGELADVFGQIMAKLAQILVESKVRKAEKPDISGWNMYKVGQMYEMEIRGKKVYAICVGITFKDTHFIGDESYANLPIFVYDSKIVDPTNYREVGKEYLRQEPKADVYETCCGYSLGGEPIMRFNRREMIAPGV